MTNEFLLAINSMMAILNYKGHDSLFDQLYSQGLISDLEAHYETLDYQQHVIMMEFNLTKLGTFNIPTIQREQNQFTHAINISSIPDGLIKQPFLNHVDKIDVSAILENQNILTYKNINSIFLLLNKEYISDNVLMENTKELIGVVTNKLSTSPPISFYTKEKNLNKSNSTTSSLTMLQQNKLIIRDDLKPTLQALDKYLSNKSSRNIRC